MSRRLVWFGLFVACVTLVLAGLVGCGLLPSKSGNGSGTQAAPTLEEYLAADTLTADFSLVSIDGTTTSFESTGTLWVEGRKFRYSLWVDGKLLRTIMSPDGVTAYFVDEETKSSEPSVASVDRYLLEFSEPDSSAVESGVDEETGATRVVYPVKAIDDLTGAANAWYTEDVTYLVKDGKVIGVETRGDSPNSDGSPYDLRTTRRMFTDLRVGEKIPDGTFDLPYPIKAAE